MLAELKYNDNKGIEDFISYNLSFIREFYASSISDDKIYIFELFNNPKTISEEIKEKEYLYFLIKSDNKHVGNLVLKKNNDELDITEFFIKKEYRKQKLSHLIIEELKNYAIKNNFKNLKIAIPEKNKKLLTIVQKWGFVKFDFIARYLGDGVYIYEDEYILKIISKDSCKIKCL